MNNARENYDYAKVTPCLVWNPNQNNSVMPYIHAEYSTTRIRYSGNSPSRQNYDIGGCMGGVKYTYENERWSAGGLVGWVYANTDLSGTRIEDNYPQGNIFGTFSPNDMNQLELTYAFGKQVPDTYQKSPNMLRQDELMWYAGTPGLENIWHHQVQGTYTWLPDNRWQLALTGSYFIADNRVVTVYTPDGPDGTMLRRYLNNGNYRCGWVTANATARFLNGKLVARVCPGLTCYRTTGEYAMKQNDLYLSTQLTWYFGNFYLFGWYSLPSTELSMESAYREKTPAKYQLQIGWGHGPWKASAAAYNFLRGSWESSRQELSSRYYDARLRTFGTAQHMRFQLSLTYTFGYGKKVDRADEVTSAGTGQSAILK